MLTSLPYKRIKWLIGRIRTHWFSVQWPSRDSIIVRGIDCAELDRVLRERWGFEGAYLAYHYEGECLNLRRPDGVDTKQMELHIRARKRHDAIEILCHRESSRYEAKESHINGDYLSWDDGQQAMRDILEVEGIEYD